MEKAKLKVEDFEVLTTLGMGTFSRVRLARHKQTGRCYALKIIKKAKIMKLKQVQQVKDEFNLLSRLSHPFIVHVPTRQVGMEGLTQDTRCLYYLLEYVGGGELLTFIRNSNTLPPPATAFYAGQVLLIYEYLHALDIVYRDLKPENLLIGDDGYLKLCDFGLAKHLPDNRTTTLVGTPEYVAPQILLGCPYGKSVDWWSLGVLSYEMAVGESPFLNEDPMITYLNISKGSYKHHKIEDRDTKAFVHHLLQVDITKRSGVRNSVDDVKKMNLFSNRIDFKKLLNKKEKVPFKPAIKYQSDTSNFPGSYPDSTTMSPPIKPNDDPFLEW